MKLTTILSVFLIASFPICAQTFDFYADVTEGCSPQKVIFFNMTDSNIRDNYSYEWVVESGKYSTQTDSVQNTYLKPGTYTAILKVYDKAKLKLLETITKENYVTIYNDPDVTIKSDKDSTCENKPFQFSIDKVVADTSITDYTWILSDGTIYYEETPPPHTFYFTDDFEIFLSIRDAHGCTNRERTSIWVHTKNDYPEISYTPSPRKTCDDKLDVTFTNKSIDPDIVSYHWDFGDNTSFNGKNPPKHTYTGYGKYYALLSAVSRSECENIVPQLIQLIDYKPEIQITDKFPEVIFDTLNYNTYMKQDSLTDCPCSQKNDQIDYKIITNENKGCIGPITFTDVTPSDDNITWEWTLSKKDPVTMKTTLIAESTEPTFTEDITESGTYVVTMKSSNGVCSDEVSRIFYIEEPLDITIEPENGFYCENPAYVDFKATSNVEGTNFLWRFGGSNLLYLGDSYTATYTSEGYYENKLYAISPNYCRYSQVTSKNIEITRPVLSNYETGTRFSASPNKGCVPLDVDFDVRYKYNTEQDSIKSITWYFADPDNNSETTNFDTKTLKGQSHTEFTYADTGVFLPRVTLETYKGCSISVNSYPLSDMAIKVGDVPNISVSYEESEICAKDEVKINVTFNDNKEKYSSIFDTLTVVFKDLNEHETINMKTPVEEHTTITFSDTIGEHKSFYHISDNGCSIDVEDNYIVNVSGPMVYLALSETDCDNPYIYSAYLKKKIGLNSCEWFLSAPSGTTQVAENVDTVHFDFKNYDGRGKYKIKVVAHGDNSECDMVDSLMLQVTDIQCDFDMKYNTYCLNSNIDFVVSCNMGQDIANWSWYYDWNDSTASAMFASCASETLYRFDQPYTTSEINSCGETVIVKHEPAKEVLYIVDTSNITSVAVVASDIHGCTDTLRKPINIAAPQAVFKSSIISDCLPYETTLTDTSSSLSIITKRIWSIDGTMIDTTNKKSVTTTIENPGYKTVSLIVTDDFGCSDTATKVNYIQPSVPNTSFTVDHPKLCLGIDATFTRNLNRFGHVDNLSKYTWDFGDQTQISNDGNLDKVTTYSYKTSSKKTFDVSLIGYCISPEGNECVDTTTQTIDVKNVSSTIKIKNSDLCKEPGQKFIVYLDNTIYNNNVRRFDWWKIDGGDSLYIGNKRSLQAVTFNNYGDQMLCLRTQSDYYGCEDTTTKLQINVPGYDATLRIDKDSACIREDITLTLVDTLNLYRYPCYWEFGDGNSKMLQENPETYAYTSLAATEDNTYKIQFIVNAEGCKPRDISANITIFPVIADFTRGVSDLDTAGCPPYSVTFYNKSVANESASYQWNFGNGETSTEKQPKITINDLNTLIPVTLSVASNICNDKITKNVQTYPAASVSVDMDSVICYGTTIHASATGDFKTIQWEPRDLFTNSKNATTDISVKKSQQIYIETTSLYDCKNTDSIFVFVQQKPYYIGAPDNKLLFYNSKDSLISASAVTNNLIAGQTYNLNVEAIPGVNYIWSPGKFLSCTSCISPDLDLACGSESTTDCIDLPTEVEYTIAMTDSLGCFTNDTTIHFNIVFDTKIALPEAFTPNEDGNNDIAYARGWGIREFVELKIFNRWGQLVFETNDITQGWDGTFNGKAQSMDTYAYTIKAIDMEGKDVFVKGYITLLR